MSSWDFINIWHAYSDGYPIFCPDGDGDGVSDCVDTLLGNVSSPSTNFAGLNITVDGSSNLAGSPSGVKNVQFNSGAGKIVDANFDFSNDKIILNDITIKKQSSGGKGYALVSGLNLGGGVKSLYIDRLVGSDSLCVKDSEITEITELSGKCNGASEYKIKCPSTGVINCSIVGSQYKIDGLHHSGGAEVKGVMSTVPGTLPFYTLNSSNPYDYNSVACLADMHAGDKCNTTWRVNTTGLPPSTWNFFVAFASTNYSAYVNDSYSPDVNVSIMGPSINGVDRKSVV
jgi:hypothetical protein